MRTVESSLSGTLSESVDDADLREQARLTALRDLDLLDTPESESFDRITRMASRLFQAPITAVSLTDQNRQWFKSYVGTAGREIPRDGAPCAEVTRSESLLVIPDLLKNPQFDKSLLAQAGIRFYAGAPLTTRDGFVLGAMCVLDKEPRVISSEQAASLQDFAAMVMAQIELQHDFGRIEPSSGLPNRNQLVEDLRDLARKDHDGERAAILIDLTGTQRLNEVVNVLGTSFIDHLIAHSSKVIRDTLGHKSGIYHVGATSFAIILDEATDGAWPELVQELSAKLKLPILCGGVPVVINAAFGISVFQLAEKNLEDVLRTALSAAQDARETETEYAVYSAASNDKKFRRFTVLTEFGRALSRRDELSLVYQPRIDFKTGVCVSAEALLRWHSPSLGSVSPGEFVPLVEQTEMARPMTQWVLNAALDQIAEWRRRHMDVRLSINVSSRNLEEPDFALELARALKLRGVPPSAIELEFTESALIRSQTRVTEQLEQVRALGVELAIDDFGTGYSSFSYLHKLPAKTLKIDQSFVRPLATNSREQTLVGSMITMAHDIGYRVVAEGVETEAIYALLAEAGCDEAQGYLISRPLAVNAFEKWLETRKDSQMLCSFGLLQQGLSARPAVQPTKH